MRAHLATSLFDVKCHEGFHCVSAVDVFGRHHDGAYKGLPVGEVTPVRYRGAYEAACPARGKMSSAGNCVDQEKGPVSFCWSSSRYEAGPTSPCKDPSMCMCVKDGPSGTGVDHPNESSQRVAGRTLQTKTFLVQPEAQCEDCAAHNCDRIQCNKCKNCEYGTKTIMGRTAKGCYFRDSGVSKTKRVRADEGRAYLFAGMEGQESQEQEQKLVVIPHYQLWNPEDTRTPKEVGGKNKEHAAHELQFPYQSRREPLSREAWIDAYKNAAPAIQRMMDTDSEKVKEWGPKANDIDCTQDVSGFLGKAKNFRRECKKHQEIINMLAPHTPFESSVADGKGGFTPVNCVMGEQGMCQSLNCYSDDVDVLKGLDQLNERYKTCRKALGILVQEEEENGPIDPKADVSARTGGRLEVPLPPPSEGAGAQLSMPIDVAFAVVSAVGAVSAARANFAKDSGPTSRGEFRSGSAQVCKSSKGKFGRAASMTFHDFLYTRSSHELMSEVACT